MRSLTSQLYEGPITIQNDRKKIPSALRRPARFLSIKYKGVYPHVNEKMYCLRYSAVQVTQPSVLYPSLFRLYRKGNLGEHFVVIGTARRPWSDEHYREVVKETIRIESFR